jgi:hypothetical protein
MRIFKKKENKNDSGTIYLDMKGNVLFRDPWMYKRMFAVGQDLIENYKYYIVRGCAFKKNVMYVNVEEEK